MKKLILFVLVAYGFVNWYQTKHGNPFKQAVSHGEVIMYSLTTCGYCKQKAVDLRRENIVFTEYFIDTDRYRRDEVNQKLSNAGFKPQRYGVPILDVHGTMLPNNPSMSKIKSAMKNL